MWFLAEALKPSQGQLSSATIIFLSPSAAASNRRYLYVYACTVHIGYSKVLHWFEQASGLESIPANLRSAHESMSLLLVGSNTKCLAGATAASYFSV